MRKETLERVQAWIFETALPFWAAHGVDAIGGGAVESLRLEDAQPSGVDFKRLRVTCRQLYVFSHAEMLGWPGARAAADALWAFLDAAWQGPQGGWPRRLTRAGAVLDPAADLYDYAFALFALGWRYAATRDPAALARAHASLDFMEAQMRHPAGGFHAELPAPAQRLQNPHMHLMEAALILAEASGEARFLALADEMAALFVERLAPDGVLREVFAADWGLLASDEGRRVEPGHMFEWAWILGRRQKLGGGADHTARIKALVDWAEAHGVDGERQITYNCVRDDGVLIDAGSRTWPNTERAKAWIARAEALGEKVFPAQAEASLRVVLDRYLAPAPPGCWIDAFDGEGRPAAANIPTSTLYHVFLAFAEALRFAGN